MSPHLDLTAPYTPLVRRIESEATSTAEILRIDHFLNHRIEPGFIFELAHELARRLSSSSPTSSSPPKPAASPRADRRQDPQRADGVRQEVLNPGRAPSISRRSLAHQGRQHPAGAVHPLHQTGQRIVIVDDFLANGRTAIALIDMAREAGAEVLGAGFVVEKRFKHRP
jgi:xanthine phosphoribosyltransferase